MSALLSSITVPSFVLLQGAVSGLNVALLAVGLVLIYRANRVLNLAQAQFGVLAAVVMAKLVSDFGIEYWAALAMVLPVAAAAGALCELVLRRLWSRPRVVVMVATIGLTELLYLLSYLPFVKPTKLFKAFPLPFATHFRLGGQIVGPPEILTLVIAPIVALALAAFIRWSPLGLAMRAMSENAESARLSGVWVRRTSTMVWAVAGLLSAVAAILASPGQVSAISQPLSPDLLLLALTAGLVGAMTNLTTTFVAAVVLGMVNEVLQWNIQSTSAVELIQFGLLMVVLLLRVRTLRIGPRQEERSSWAAGLAGRLAQFGSGADLAVRRRVGQAGTATVVVVAALLPLVASVGQSYWISQLCIYAVVALSLTVLTGWSGQVSLGQFGLVAIGSDLAVHFGPHLPLVVLLLLAGAVTAIVAIVVGLPALRVKGLYLAVSTLGLGLFVQQSLLATPCWQIPFTHHSVCTGLPDPGNTYVLRPTLFGLSLDSERAFAWLSLAVLGLTVLAVRIWRDRGVARALVAVRDNEVGAGATGVPVVRTKLVSFALAGFLAGYAGVLLAFSQQRFTTDTFDPAQSILVVAVVVIGGLGSISGALLGTLYAVGLPAIIGVSTTSEFLVSGAGLTACVLYLPSGLAEGPHVLGDLVAMAVVRLRARRAGGGGTLPLDVAGPPPPRRSGAWEEAAATTTGGPR